MPFEKGKVANPNGLAGRKIFVDALHSIITQQSDGGCPPLPQRSTVAHVMAQRLVEGALRTDWKPGEALAYMQEICDRAYGKPKQALTAGDDDDKALIPDKIEIVLRNAVGNT